MKSKMGADFANFIKKYCHKYIREAIKAKKEIKLTDIKYKTKKGARLTLNILFYPFARQGRINEVVTIIEDNTKLKELEQRLKDTEILLQRTYLESIRALVEALEAKDEYTGGHSERVRKYALLIAAKLRLTKNERDILEHACVLHDIGKVGISDAIINKKERFTYPDFVMMVKHPEIAEKILEPIKALHLEQPIVRHHHERYNGMGYPDSKKGEESPLGSRIITVADSFDAMTSERPYRKAMPAEEAIEEIKKGSGTQFDPKVVEAFLQVAQEKNLLKRTAKQAKE